MHLLCLGAMPPLCSVCLIHGTDDTTMFEKLPICSDCTQHINTYLFTPNIIKKMVIQFNLMFVRIVLDMPIICYHYV